MQELEKILEEIELEKKRVSLSPDCSNEHAVTETILLEKIEKIIRKHMNGGWIPVDDRLPEDAESKKGKRQRMTNADRVRQMDDDELADFIIKGCIGEKRACCSHDETVEWLRWEDSISNGEG